MKKFSNTKVFLLSLLLIAVLTSFSFIAIKKAEAVCTEVNETCQERPANKGTEVFWDQVSSSLVSLVSI